MKKIDQLKLNFSNWRIKRLRSLVQKRLVKRRKIEKELIPFQFQSLAPSDESDEDNIYCDALKSAFEQKGIYNIGLTGNYGSGKSSVLRTFEKRFKSHYSILKISLATFSPLGLHENGKGSKNDTSIQELELSILQQLLYREKPRTLRYSRISRIRKTSQWKLVIYAALAGMWLHSCVFILKPGFLEGSYLWGILSWNDYKQEINSVSWGLFGAGTIILLYRLIWSIRGASISRLKVKDGELEINHETEHSIINKYLDEILYFFEETDYDIVIIEDLDRYENETIFAKLRELNGVLNNSAQVDRKVRFVYAVKDDLFRELKSRTKFFDLIIPVIPIVNNTNSGNKLFEWLKESGYDQKIKKRFLLDISLYIDDMRMIKNMFNEFLIYEKIIGKDLIPGKLLGMIVYKNLYPKEFSLLHHGKGELKVILDHKLTYTQSKIEKYKTEIKSKESEITKDFEYLGQEEQRSLTTSIRTKVKFLQSRIREEKSWSIGKIFREEYDLFRSNLSISLDELTVYLIKHEYIDENFENYISYFYSGIFTQEESNLLQAISTNQSLNHNLEVDNLDEFVSKIDLSQFRSISVLNISILDFLLSNKSRYEAQVEAITDQSKHNNTEFKKFLVSYLNLGSQIDELFVSLSPAWRGLWNFIASSREIKNDLKSSLFISFIENVPLEEINNQNDNDAVKKYIEFKHDILTIWPEDLNSTLVEALVSVDAKFRKLRTPIVNEELLHEIYVKNLYALNYEMIEFILTNELKEDISNTLKTSNFSTILGSENKHIIEYLNANLEVYTHEVYLKLEQYQEEEPKFIIELLNNKDLDEKTRAKIIGKSKTIIDSAATLEDNVLTSQLFREGKLTVNWDNVFVFYERNEEMTEDLIQFYEDSYDKLSKLMVPNKANDDEDSIQKKICRNIIYANKLTHSAYKALLKSIPYYYHSLDYKQIESSKVLSLISERKVRLSDKNYFSLKDSHPHISFDLIEKAWRKEVEDILGDNNFNITASDIRKVLKSKTISTELKMRIAQRKAKRVLKGEGELANDLCFFFSSNDILNLDWEFICLILSESITDEYKLVFLKETLNSKAWSKSQILELLKASGKPFAAVNIRGGGSFNIDMTPLNESVCNLLNIKGVISSFSINEKRKEIKVNRKRKQ
jgi:hypothetical protein